MKIASTIYMDSRLYMFSGNHTVRTTYTQRFFVIFIASPSQPENNIWPIESGLIPGYGALYHAQSRYGATRPWQVAPVDNLLLTRFSP